MNIDRAREMADSLISDNETSITTLGSYGDEVALVLKLDIERLERELSGIRDLLSSQKDKTCLGTGHIKGVQPWPIVDEVIDGINRVLAD